MIKRRYEVQAEDENGDLWIVATEILETAEAQAKKFRDENYKNVVIKNNE